MKLFYYIVLAILVLLAVSSGVAKVMLMEREVEFFSQYGFTHSILIAYGATQIIGGVLLAVPKAKVIGAIIIAITFLISAALLILSGNIPQTLLTFIALLLLVFLAKNSPTSKTNEIDA